MLGLHKRVPVVSPAVARNVKPCGHTQHVGTCPHCQQAQLNRWHIQLEQARSR